MIAGQNTDLKRNEAVRVVARRRAVDNDVDRVALLKQLERRLLHTDVRLCVPQRTLLPNLFTTDKKTSQSSPQRLSAKYPLTNTPTSMP